jgi:hypothetical protein
VSAVALAITGRALAGTERAEAPVVSIASPVGELSYTPGRGARLGDTGLTLGGYSNLNVTRNEGGPALLSLDDVSLFVGWDPTPRFHLFSELEFEDLVEVDDHGRGGTNGWTFTAERLYGDLLVSDSLVFRLGKFLTPVGRWNVIHAQPLVWTTSRPLATTLPFDPHTTGAMLSGTVAGRAGTVDYTAFGQFTNALDPAPEPQLQDRAGGARLEYTAPAGWSVGGTYLAFTRSSVWHHLGGLDTLWRRGRFEVQGEFTYEEQAAATSGTQWGLYVQPVIELLPRTFLVTRYEHYDQSFGGAVNIGVAGLAWRPLPYLVLKAEYLFADHPAAESSPGFKSSVAILF